MGVLLFFLGIAAAGALGWAAARLRADLRLRPRGAGVGAALAGAPFLAVWLGWGGGYAVLPLFVAIGPLVWFDIRRRVLPNEITLPLIALCLLIGVAEGRGVDAAFGAGLGFAAFWAIGAAWRRFRGVDALGLGDAKLLAGIGAGLGVAALPHVVLIAALTGVAYGLAGRGFDIGDEIPFAPPLALGAAVVWAMGPLF